MRWAEFAPPVAFRPFAPYRPDFHHCFSSTSIREYCNARFFRSYTFEPAGVDFRVKIFSLSKDLREMGGEPGDGERALGTETVENREVFELWMKPDARAVVLKNRTDTGLLSSDFECAPGKRCQSGKNLIPAIQCGFAVESRPIVG